VGTSFRSEKRLGVRAAEGRFSEHRGAMGTGGELGRATIPAERGDWHLRVIGSVALQFSLESPRKKRQKLPPPARDDTANDVSVHTRNARHAHWSLVRPQISPWSS